MLRLDDQKCHRHNAQGAPPPGAHMRHGNMLQRERGSQTAKKAYAVQHSPRGHSTGDMIVPCPARSMPEWAAVRQTGCPSADLVGAADLSGVGESGGFHDTPSVTERFCCSAIISRTQLRCERTRVMSSSTRAVAAASSENRVRASSVDHEISPPSASEE